MNEQSEKAVVTIIYKSGAKVHITCDSFEVSRNAESVFRATWKGASPDPLVIGLKEIAAVYEGIA